MKLIICEKPSLALNIAKALGKFEKYDGYFRMDNYLITFAFGHLFTLKNVNDYYGEKKKWHEVPLPYVPEKFQYKVRNDEGVIKQLKIMKKLLEDNDITEIINCGDADREGQIIIDTIIKKLKTKVEVTRLWLPEQTGETIRAEIKKTRSNNEFMNLQREGYARAYMDWLFGINLTRYVSLKRGTLLRVGRVIIPIVKYIYDRDLEIRNFVPEKYSQLVSDTKVEGTNVKLEVKKKYKATEKDKMLEKQKELNNEKAIVKDVKKDIVKKKPKKLFSLSKLQSELSKTNKINFETSLKSIQSLYEKGYITYPRTNTEYLAENEVSKMNTIIKNYPEINLKVKKIKSIFDDSKIESHSAITITNKREEGSLKGMEKTIYDTIWNRFISNFLDEETIISKTLLKIQVADEIFTLKGEVVETEGFFKYEPQKITDNLPKLSIGDTFDIKFKEIKKETKAPAKATESSLSNFLKNPFKTDKTSEEEEYKAILDGVEIGTEATRTGIIEKCVKEEYISRKGQNYSIEALGEDLIVNLDKLDINLYKERTIEFSKMLKMVYKGNLALEELIDSTKGELSSIISKDIKIQRVAHEQPDKEKIGECPKCGGNIYQGKTKTGKTNYYCNEYKQGCTFTLWEETRHFDNKIKITKTKAKSLLKGTNTKFKLKNKSGKEYEAFLKIKLNGNYVNFEVNGFPEKKEIKQKEQKN